jgi:ubiquinone/menaquinone biosynthesis C-methylase UbiE
MSLWELLSGCIPTDHSRQVTSEFYAEQAVRTHRPKTVVDLGCGVGASYDLFRGLDTAIKWLGIDIRDSPEANQRTREDAIVVHYDGTRLPLRDESVPLIYSHQVLEHVLHPRRVLAEVCRTLTPGGLFVGSTSQLEPYHSYSVWNFTPYGFRTIVEETGLRLREIRPSIDGSTMIRRQYLANPPEYGRYFASESPLNAQIDEWAKRERKSTAVTNVRKLQFCGQFAFLVEKPARTGKAKNRA